MASATSSSANMAGGGAVPQVPELDPGDRLLCGPGPSNVHPRVRAAMQRKNLDWQGIVLMAVGIASL